MHTVNMDFCKQHKFLHTLPRLTKQIIWSWQAENGTIFQIPEKNLYSPAECFIELINVSVAIFTVLVAIILIFKYKCSVNRNFSKSLLPLHVSRTLLCILLLLILSLELCESMLTSISLSSILTMIAILSCWILHRETEIRDGFGTAVSAGGFAIIGLSRAWKFLYLCRLGLSIQSVRVTTTGITAACCGLLAFIDSYTLYRMMQRSRRYTVQSPDSARNSYVFSTSPFLSRITFHWVTDLLLHGYQMPLELHDLGQLPDEETTRNQFKRFRDIYETEKLRCRGQKLSLWKCFWKRIWLTFLAGSILKLFGDAMTLVGPMTIPMIINYASNLQNRNVTYENIPSKGTMVFSQILKNGYFLGIIVFFATILQSTLKQASTHVLCVGGIRLRTALQALIYDKALRLSFSSISEEEKLSNKDKEQHCQQQTTDVGTLTNLMAEDAYNVMNFFWIIHYIWAVPLKITAIIFLLYLKLGKSAIIGVSCCILIVTPMQLLLGKRMSENSKFIAEKSDARLRLLNEILQGIRFIKLHAWENLFENRIRKTRDQELKLLKKDSIYWTLINFLTHVFSVLVTLFTFGIYFWLEEQNLDAGNVFASLALFSQLTMPLFIFPVIVPIIINAMISTTRLEEYLQLPEIMNILPEPSNRKLTTNIFSKTNSCTDNDVEAINNVTTFGSLGNIMKDDEDTREVLREFNLPIDSSTDTVFEKETEIPESILKVTPSTFAWRSDENTLMINALNFPRGQLTIITGKTGSGKTSLLLALLGEIQKTSGSVAWTKGLKIAYVARQPWLQNATLKDNILFGSPYRSRRYRNVLYACALQPDIDILPDRDLTRIDERGINLSGGQKQRVAIARALYSDTDVVLLDDPLSALDQHVGQQIFDHGIKKLLLRSGRTVIMITHRLELLSSAHQVIVMDGCRVRAVGTKSSIEDVDPELAAEWRIMNSRQREDEKRFQKTAEDRWSLIKLVYKIGLNKNPPAFIPLRLRREALSGSMYWSHVFTDFSISAEEWETARKGSITHSNIVRVPSFQMQKQPASIFCRQNSTPVIRENRRISRRRNNTYNNGQPSSVLKQLFSGRYPDEIVMNKDKNTLSQLMPGPNKITQHHDQYHHFPVKQSLELRTTDEMDNLEETLNEDDVNEQDKLEVDDKSGMVTRMIWMEYPKAAGWIPELIYVIAALIFQVLRVYTDFWLSEWMEERIHSPLNTMSYSMMYIIISVTSIFLSILYNVSGQWAGARARRKLHQQAIAGLLGAPISFFDCNLVGKILSRFSTDMSVIDKKMATAIKRLTSFALLCGSVMLINVITSPWFLITVVPISCAYYALQKFYRRTARQLQCLDGSTRGPVVAHFSETLSGLPTLRAFKQENRFMEEIMKRLDINTNAFLILNSSSRWFGIALDYLGAVIVVIAISTALLSVELYPNRVTPRLVGLAINYTLLVPMLNWMIKFSAEIELYMGSVARICAYRNVLPEKLHENGVRVANDWPNKGEIVFENVCLRYDVNRNPVITDLSLKIPAKQKLGICGRTGSGKSSTVMALFRLIEISQGRILLDGIDIRKVPLQILRSRLSAIPQDAIMFSGTIRENLDPFSQHKDQEIWRALELSQIKDVIASHPEGLSLEVREGGENFSAGQLQLLCVARAILQRSNIIVLDEATSALDIATEKSLLKAAAVAFEDKTVITIAHRAAALLDCDRILVFDEGKIIEEGTPADLMQRQNGVFSAMIKAIEQGGKQ
ncbi:ATP-binding cassette sub-family C member Sur [Pogonomyrmex barbatus]|uniref:ATP-binding cassette sub-family C member Sur n=1 Tax=Pogonomyrmex barbatus TaxID=144034 RepID=A0A6I9W2X9_9HYME|nr:ATP-binding cassette sub-family C member Sur [Pogonomyrmex barbatus]